MGILGGRSRGMLVMRGKVEEFAFHSGLVGVGVFSDGALVD